MTVVARRYAQALFDAADSPAERTEIAAAVDAFEKALKGSIELRKFILAQNYTKEQRFQVVDTLFNKVKSPTAGDILFFNLLKLLIQKGRFILIPEIFSSFQNLLLGAENTQIAEVSCAHDLTPEAEKKLKKVLTDRFEKKILLKTISDKSLLGGLRIRVGSFLFDDSLKTRLERIRRHMKEA